MTDQRSTELVTVGDVQIEVIARVVVRVEPVCGAIVGVALKVPIAVVVRSPAGTWQVDLESSTPCSPPRERLSAINDVFADSLPPWTTSW